MSDEPPSTASEGPASGGPAPAAASNGRAPSGHGASDGRPGDPQASVRARLGRAGEAVPGLARAAASAAWHTTGWGLRTTVRTGARVALAATSAEEASALLDEITGTVEDTVATVGDLARRAAREAAAAAAAAAEEIEEPPPTLRERGQDLLRLSREVEALDEQHPAFGRILGELAPDEARVLLLLLEGGPQPSVDVRTGGPVGRVSSQLVAPGLTMIGGRAGCRAPERVPAYLNNLFRLGLIWFSRESLRDPMDYQVLEAQPDVLAALHTVRFPRVVRRSIHLTPFGDDFCRSCLVEEDQHAEDFPRHGTPANDGGGHASPSAE